MRSRIHAHKTEGETRLREADDIFALVTFRLPRRKINLHFCQRMITAIAIPVHPGCPQAEVTSPHLFAQHRLAPIPEGQCACNDEDWSQIERCCPVVAHRIVSRRGRRRSHHHARRVARRTQALRVEVESLPVGQRLEI